MVVLISPLCFAKCLMNFVSKNCLTGTYLEPPRNASIIALNDRLPYDDGGV